MTGSSAGLYFGCLLCSACTGTRYLGDSERPPLVVCPETKSPVSCRNNKLSVFLEPNGGRGPGVHSSMCIFSCNPLAFSTDPRPCYSGGSAALMSSVSKASAAKEPLVVWAEEGYLEI